MATYYLDKAEQPDGSRSLHREGCEHIPPADDRVFLGHFYNPHEAAQRASDQFPTVKVNACQICAKAAKPPKPTH